MDSKGDSLFEGLPPPAAPVSPPARPPSPAIVPSKAKAAPPGSALRTSSTPSNKRLTVKPDGEGARRVRFKSNEVEASDEQVLAAMGRIASHIGNPGKFSKASKLAVQLLEAGSVKLQTVDAFFEILRASMASPSQSVDPKVWQDYQALFGAVWTQLEHFSPSQQLQIEVWELWAVLANEFRTDDTFAFSKASNRVRQYVDLLPEAKEDDELIPLQAELKSLGERVAVASSLLEEAGGDSGLVKSSLSEEGARDSRSSSEPSEAAAAESDPFGLNALMTVGSKKEEKARRKRDEEAAANIQAHEDAVRLLNDRREALIASLKIAVDRYRFPWAQTIVDLLVKHAFDSLNKFTSSQKKTIEQLWASIREQLLSRKYGKAGASGKLDVTPFERMQSQYAQEHISIRRAVGSSGERSAEQWLG